MSIKKALQLDQHALVDSLSGALSNSTRAFTDAMRAFLLGPASKRHKTSKEIQEEILLVLDEIQKYSSINGNHDFDKDIEAARLSSGLCSSSVTVKTTTPPLFSRSCMHLKLKCYQYVHVTEY
jgi:hypothetical protein